MKFIDYDALNKNALYFKKILGDVKLCAVLKNNAYGHGLYRVASNLVSTADCFAVGSTDEAEIIYSLRKDIIILLPQNECNSLRAVKKGFILIVDSFDTLDTVRCAAAKTGIKARVHLKIDSGMSRLGFRYEQLADLTNNLDDNIVVEGIFSHFYGDSVADCDKQFCYFEKCVGFLKKYFPEATCHIANTAAALLSSEYHLDMVRVGLGLFGYGSEELLPVKSVFAQVIAVRKISTGDVVGYGAKYVAPRDTVVAVLNIGYADGLARSLIGSFVKINGVLLPIVAICMAMTLVDAGDTNVNVGDIATVLDKDVNIANDKVIIYELLCNLQ